VSPVKYEMGFLSQKTAFFIVTAVKTSNLTYYWKSEDKIVTAVLGLQNSIIEPVCRFVRNIS
jgi:hypothetical protein